MPGIDRNYVSARCRAGQSTLAGDPAGPKLNQSISEAINAFNSHDLESYGEFRYLVAEVSPAKRVSTGGSSSNPISRRSTSTARNA